MAPTMPGTTVIKHSLAYHAFLWAAFPFVGALLGWLLAHLPRWIEGKPLPFSGLIEILDDHSGTVMTSVLEVSVVDKAKSYKRGHVADVFTDDKHLVLLGRDTSEPVRQKTDHKSTRLQAAFEAHGYPWRDGDPYETEFARWVDGVPGLDEHANAILRARQVALDEDRSGRHRRTA